MKLLFILASILICSSFWGIQESFAKVGTVESFQKIDSLGKWFGQSVTNIGDLDGDGIFDIAVGSHADLDGVIDEGMCTSSVGAVWVLFLNEDGTVKSKQKISATEGNLPNFLVNCSKFGKAVTGLGDLNKDGIEDIAVSTDRAIGTSGSEIWILFLNEDGSVKNSKNLSSSLPTSEDRFWEINNEEISVANIGDLNNDGFQEIGIGSVYSRVDDDPLGAAWILSLDKRGNIVSHKKITSNTNGLTETLNNNNRFGSAISAIGDINKDGITDIAIGQRLEDDGSKNQGAIWILFLNEDGSVKDYQKISSKHGNFKGGLWENAQFGKSISKLGDIDGDTIPDISVGSFDSVWILFLNGDGTVKSHQKISSLEGNFTGNIERYDYFGESLGVLNSENLDQSTILVVGSPRHGYETPREDSGAVWLLDLHINTFSDFQEKFESLKGKNNGLICKENLFFIQKYNGSPACVKAESIPKLIERGWAKITPIQLDIGKTGIYTLEIDEDIVFEIKYSIKGANIVSMNSLKEQNSFKINLDSPYDGSLEISLPRNLIDAKISENEDDLFFIFVDGNEVPYTEVKDQDVRRLTLEFGEGTKIIEILGVSPLED